eukprot:4579745-Pyramimonas_sp.AAC.1
MTTQAEGGENSTVTVWALPEDNGPTMEFSDHVSAIQRAMDMEQLFWFTQFAAIGLLLVRTLKAMVRRITPALVPSKGAKGSSIPEKIGCSRKMVVKS